MSTWNDVGIENRQRILLIDDNEAIHEEIESILSINKNRSDMELRQLEDDLFGSSSLMETDVLDKNSV